MRQRPAIMPGDWPRKRANRAGWGIVSDDPDVLAVQLALANDALPPDHPAKLTADDLDALTRRPADPRDLERLADKLDALLPPPE